MSAILPVNRDDLLRCRGVESARVEFKSGWDPRTTGYQALKTIGPAGDTLRERVFRGGLATQLRGSFTYLESLLQTEIRKVPDLRGDGAERIAAAPLRFRRGANVLSHDAARAPGARPES